MNRIVSFALLVVTVSFLASCITGPKFAEYQTQMASLNPELGRIYFYRELDDYFASRSPLNLFSRKLDVLLNGEKVGEAIEKGFFYVDRAPGEYVVVTSTEVTRKASFILEKGQTRYIKFSASMGFFIQHVYGKLVDESVALSEIKDCRYTGGKSTE